MSLFFPRRCAGCGNPLQAEQPWLCTPCQLQAAPVPLASLRHNEALLRLQGQLPLAYAAYLYQHHEGSRVQRMLFNLKYHGAEHVAHQVGVRLAGRIVQAGEPLPQVLVPVPLHPSKRRKRGYNQAALLAEAMAAGLGAETADHWVVRTKATDSQTRQSAEDRWANVEGIFHVQCPEALAGKHVMLVDDVLTTGATLLSLGQSVLLAQPARLSLGLMAIAGA